MQLSRFMAGQSMLACASRWLGLLLGWVLIPTSLYSLWLLGGHSLLPIQIGMLGVSVLGLVIINGETAAVIWRGLRGCNSGLRGLLQQAWARSPQGEEPVSPQGEGLQSVEGGSPPLPFVSIIVVAYLPNEQDIITDTLMHWLTQVERPAAGWEVILAYNTPTRLPVESRLRRLARRFPDLVLLPVEGSTSKAENLNEALQWVRGDMTGIFDADHLPAADCLARAWRWLALGRYDGVQGRNLIRNYGENWLTQVIAMEFDCLYRVSHYGRSLLVDTALFGGSNGYWRTPAIQAIGFRTRMLTEDIDATLRGLVQGYRLVHDPSIVTTELAPNDLQSLWWQRLRWSQGWLEVAWLHTGRMMRSHHLDPLQKACWLVMLLYSQYFHPLVWQVVPIALSVAIVQPDHHLPLSTWNLAILGLLLMSAALQVTVALHPGMGGSRLSWRHGVYYCLLSTGYFWLKSLIALAACTNHLCGSRTWHVTRRSAPTSDAVSMEAQLAKGHLARSR